MQHIAVNDEHAALVKRLARAWSISEDEVIGRLLDTYLEAAAPSPVPQRPPSEVASPSIYVYCMYEGHRLSGRFDTIDQSLTVSDGQFSGRTFRSPSAAARSIISSINPEVNSNRNGWNFWRLVSGRPLDDLRQKGLSID